VKDNPVEKKNERDCFDGDFVEVLPPQMTCVERLLSFTGKQMQGSKSPFIQKEVTAAPACLNCLNKK